jgi:hypothetical protein
LAAGRFCTDRAGYAAIRQTVTCWPDRVWAVEGSKRCGPAVGAATDDDLAQLITLDPEEVWRRLAAEDGDKSDLVLAATKIAGIDGRVSSREQAVIADIKRHCEAD